MQPVPFSSVIADLQDLIRRFAVLDAPKKTVFTALAQEICTANDHKIETELSKRFFEEIKPEKLLRNLPYLFVYCLFLETHAQSKLLPPTLLSEAAELLIKTPEDLPKLSLLEKPGPFRLSLILAYILGVELKKNDLVAYCQAELNKLPRKRDAYLKQDEALALRTFAERHRDPIVKVFCDVEITIILILKAKQGINLAEEMCSGLKPTFEPGDLGFWLPKFTLKKGCEEIGAALKMLDERPMVRGVLELFKKEGNTNAFKMLLQGVLAEVYLYEGALAEVYLYGLLTDNEALSSSCQKLFFEAVFIKKLPIFTQLSDKDIALVWKAAAVSNQPFLKLLCMTIVRYKLIFSEPLTLDNLPHHLEQHMKLPWRLVQDASQFFTLTPEPLEEALFNYAENLTFKRLNIHGANSNQDVVELSLPSAVQAQELLYVKEEIELLEIRSCRLNTLTIKMLISGIAKHPACQNLILEKALFSEADVLTFLQELQYCSELRSLRLHEVSFTEKSLETFALCLTNLPKLKFISLRGCSLDAQGFKILQPALKSLNLDCLSLHGNDLTEEDVKEIKVAKLSKIYPRSNPKRPIFDLDEVSQIYPILQQEQRVLSQHTLQTLIEKQLFQVYRFSLISEKPLLKTCRKTLAQKIEQEKDFPELIAKDILRLWNGAKTYKDPLLMIFCLRWYAKNRAPKDVPEEIQKYLPLAPRLSASSKEEGLSKLVCHPGNLQDPLVRSLIDFCTIDHLEFRPAEEKKVSLKVAEVMSMAIFLYSYRHVSSISFKNYAMDAESISLIFKELKEMSQLDIIDWHIEMDDSGRRELASALSNYPKKLKVYLVEESGISAELKTQLVKLNPNISLEELGGPHAHR